MKKWTLQLEVSEGNDEFWEGLNYENQHDAVKTFILDALHANGFDTKIRLNKYEEEISEDYVGVEVKEEPAAANTPSE